ncbi:hypothetical protein LXA43DRAFT_847035, partial [Ganoderma leucocontextum]
EDLKISLEYTRLVQEATLENSGLDDEVIARLRHPIEEECTIPDPDTRLSIDLYLAVGNASEETYKAVCDAICRRMPEATLLSFYMARSAVEKLTGVVPVRHDMCVNSCIGYT